jgi:hypothetical protein
VSALFGLYLGCGAAVLPARAASEPAEPDFTGVWVQDEAALSTTKEPRTASPSGSAVPPAPPPPPPSVAAGPPPRLHIGKQGPLLVLELRNADGTKLSTIVLTTDGAENVNSRGEGLPLHRSRSVWNGAVLETVWTIEQNGRVTISGTDRRERTGPDPLVVTTTTADAQSTRRSVTVYRRAP